MEVIFASAFGSRRKGSPTLQYLFLLADAFVKKLTEAPELESAREQTRVSFTEEEIEDLLLKVPFVLHSEKVTPHWLFDFFSKLNAVFARDSENYPGTMRQYFTSLNPDLQTAEKLCFQIVENPEDERYPFAFMVTYTRKEENGRVHHVPLYQALQEYDADDPRLLSLLSSLSKACEISELIDEMTVSGELMHPLRLTVPEAFSILKTVDELQKIGIACRVPNWWKKKSSSVSMNVSMNGKKDSLFGLNSLIELKPSLMVNGHKLTKAEIRQLLASEEGLMRLKGEWVEVDHEKLQELLSAMEEVSGSLSLADLLRREGGLEGEEAEEEAVTVTQNAFLKKLLEKMRQPALQKPLKTPKGVHAELREYQKSGVSWLQTLGSNGFGALLADDMGLGKTLQILTYLEGIRQKNPDARILLIVPASLLGNWQKEAEKFVPGLPIRILHGKTSEKLAEDLEKEEAFLTVTTYGMASRLEELRKKDWEILILDEAQAIKNPNTKQTRAIKSIPARLHIALTGTPVENDLSNLWSLFDFTNRGLLGNRTQFTAYARKLQDHPEGYGRLKGMISPFLLRRVKTDPNIAPDLPAKTEIIDYVELTKKQSLLYHQQIEKLEQALSDKEEGTERKGLVLAALTHLKQICNHPDQFTGLGEFRPSESGKFEMLKEVVEPIRENRECVLVFTQYRSMVKELDAFLEKQFGRKGRIIDGSTPAALRTQYAEEFNEQKTWIPYMVLSLKAAGTGLNLVAASHVIHFDRWWNPAVENQATDRAFRIGQTKNVMAHKFVAKNTVEEKIEELMESKKALADSLIGQEGEGAEKWLTEMSNEELINTLRIDL